MNFSSFVYHTGILLVKIKIDNKEWQLIIKKTKRSGYAFEAINKNGKKIILECNSYGRSSIDIAVQEALVEALLQDKDFHNCTRRKQKSSFFLQQQKKIILARTNYIVMFGTG